MSPLNKFEAIGIFLSVAVMAVALSMLRFQTDGEGGIAQVDGDTQSALVVVGDESSEGDDLRQALTAAASSQGEIQKLVIDDIKIGTGEKVKEGDTLSVHYIGSTPAGVQFDSSYARGEPFTFTVGEHRVIEGWEKGLIGMQVGGQRILVIPSDMAYGDRKVGPIEAGTTLIFAVELMEIK